MCPRRRPTAPRLWAYHCCWCVCATRWCATTTAARPHSSASRPQHCSTCAVNSVSASIHPLHTSTASGPASLTSAPPSTRALTRSPLAATCGSILPISLLPSRHHHRLQHQQQQHRGHRRRRLRLPPPPRCLLRLRRQTRGRQHSVRATLLRPLVLLRTRTQPQIHSLVHAKVAVSRRRSPLPTLSPSVRSLRRCSLRCANSLRHRFTTAHLLRRASATALCALPSLSLSYAIVVRLRSPPAVLAITIRTLL
mmetsp:Transcript_7930/g.24499  ORF Transcript_7930/g.24499 Transcript_7930/m.24499 type:complete len:252 (+) Transcript_7930:586-1341(+)